MTIAPQLHYYDMAPGITAFSSTRQGGYSEGNYSEFNMNCYCGDDPSAIARNREALCQLLGIGGDRLVMPHQTHETRVACIDRHFLSLSDGQRREALEGIDALMTNETGVCIGVSTADCIPLLLCDTEHGAIAAVHAGWRGTVNRIAQKTVETMTQAYGTRPSQLKAQIGPGISLDSFEVGQEVYDAFQQAGFDMAAISRRYPAMGERTQTEPAEKWHIDLPECNRLQLLQAGLPSEAVGLSGICTYRQYHAFFSARRLGIRSGRIFTGIMKR